MFGGLEIKGAGSNDDRNAATAAPPPATMVSAFGFLNATPAEAPASSSISNGGDAATAATPATPASSFSFINTSPAETTTPTQLAEEEITTTTTTTTTNTSGFSYLMSSTPAAAAAPSPTTESSSAMATSSGFNFMIPSPTGETATDAPPPILPAAAPSPPRPVRKESADSGGASATTSLFGFMNTPSTTTSVAADLPPAVAPPVTTTEDIMAHPEPPAASIQVSSPSPVSFMATDSGMALSMATSSAPPAPATSSSSSTMPTGAGVVFAAPPTGAKVVKKRRGRAQKVGMGAPPPSTGNALPEPKVPTPAQSRPPAPAAPTTESSSSSKSARDEAAEAARRAEDFMNQKAMEQAREEEEQQRQQRQNLPSYGSQDSEDSRGSNIMPTASTDEVVAAAQKAAVEAQSQMAQKGRGGGFMGGLFKGFGNSNVGGGSSHGASSSSIGRSSPPTTTSTLSSSSLPPPAPMPDRVGSTTSTSSNRPAESSSKERQPSSQQQYQQGTRKTEATATGHAAASSSSVGGFQPPAPSTSSFSPPSFPPAKPPTTTTGRDPQTRTTTTTTTPLSLVPPATSSQPKTPKDILNDLLERLSTQVQQSMDQVAFVRSQRKMLLEDRFVSIAKLRLATQQIAQAEAQLQAAAKEEDYDLADQLGHVIQGHERERSETSAVLEDVTHKLAALESQKNVVIGSVAACFEKLHDQLLKLKEEEIDHETKEDTEAMKQFSTVSKQLSAEHERLQQDLKHLERDESLVAEERKELETSISEQSGIFEQQRDDAKVQLSTLEVEMEELRKLLQQKQDDAARLRTELYGLDDSISKVRVKFSRQLNRVSKKETSLNENRREWELEQAGYERQKEAHENQVQTHSNALMEREEFSEWINAELALSQEWTTLVQSQLDFCEDDDEDGTPMEEAKEGGEEAADETASTASSSNNNNNNKGTHTSSLAQMQATVVKWEAAVGEAKLVLRAATTALTNLEQEHVTLLGRLPQLEQIKKDAAARRDFKGAGKASKEIKDAQARLNIVIQELTGDASQRKDAAEEELKRLDANLGKAKKAAQEQEQIAAKAKMTQLALKLAATLNMITQRQKEDSRDDSTTTSKTDPKTATPTTTAARNSVNQVGIRVLENQMQALKLEGQALGEKFGGWKELLKEHLPQEVIGDDDDGKHATSSDEPVTSTSMDDQEGVGDKEKATKEQQPKGAVSNMTTEEKVAKYKELMRQISDAETALDDAVAKEDYERAAELQDFFEELAGQVQEMDLTEEETALAESATDGDDDDAPTSPQESTDVLKENDDNDKSPGSSEETEKEEPSPADKDGNRTEKAQDDEEEEKEEEEVTTDEAEATGEVTGEALQETTEDNPEVPTGDTPEDPEESTEAAGTPTSQDLEKDPNSDQPESSTAGEEHADESPAVAGEKNAAGSTSEEVEKEEKQEHPAEE